MKLVSVQVGRPRTVRWHGRPVSTGIYKEPVAGRIMLYRFNLDGDHQADMTVHGGPDKAVYIYPSEHYPIWQAEFPDLPLPYGMFGENFTTEGLDESSVHHRRSVPHRGSSGRGDAAACSMLQARNQDGIAPLPKAISRKWPQWFLPPRTERRCCGCGRFD